MVDTTSLNMQLFSIFSKAAGYAKNEEKRDRQIAGLIEQLVRSVREIYDRGATASFEDKIEMVQTLKHLDTAQSVRSFVETHSRNPLFRDTDPWKKFDKDGVWLFEQISERWCHSADLLKDTIRDLHEKLGFVSRDQYSRDDGASFFTPEERERIWEEGTLD